MLEIRHNPKNTHENEAFRRIALSVDQFFRENNWNGLMIGNPVAEENEEFQPDILLFTPTALLIIDLKDYKGEITLPKEDKFETEPWLLNNSIQIRGGNRLNPFDQIKKLRSRYKDILSEYNNRYPHILEELHQGAEQKDHTKGLVLFSGPITLTKDSQIPAQLRWFSISDEQTLLNKLKDFNDGFSYNPNLGNFLKRIFKADPYKIDNKVITQNITGFEERFDLWAEQKECLAHVKTFLQSDDRILLITGAEKSGKSYLIPSITSICQDLKKTDVKHLVVNNRVANRINSKQGDVHFGSVYSLIYGGEPVTEKDTEEKDEDDEDDDSLQIIPLKIDKGWSGDTVLIVDEAQLISNSEHKTDLLRFGSGKLLNDLFAFLKLSENSRKVIFIGDTNQISFGDEALSATHPEVLQELTDTSVKKITLTKSDANKNLSRISQNMLLAMGIEKEVYNRLLMKESDSVHLVTSEEAFSKANGWLTNNESFVILAYSNEEVEKTNQFVRKNLLKRSEQLTAGDLLVFNNNIRVISTDPLARPVFLNNGMLVKVTEVKDRLEELVYYKKKTQPVKLVFQKLTISALDESTPVDILILFNFMTSPNAQLAKEESTALRVFLNRRLHKLKGENPFEKSSLYDSMKNDSSWKSHSSLLEKLRQTGDDKKAIEENEKALRKIVSTYKKRYSNSMRAHQFMNDPYAHAGFVRFGWSMTVHKALGEKWLHVIVNAQMGSNSRKNKAYFQWLYSAISRAEREVYLVNWKNHHPLSSTVFNEDNVPISSEMPQPKNNSSTFIIEEASEGFKSKYFDNFSHPNVVNYVFGLCNSLEQENFKITGINKKILWLIKIAGKDSAGADFVIDLYYNKKGIPNKPSPGKPDSLIGKFISRITEVTPELSLPSDFREEVYNEWFTNLKTDGWSLESIEALEWMDRVTLKNHNSWCAFDVQYNAEGFISIVKPLKANSSETWLEIVAILKKANNV